MNPSSPPTPLFDVQLLRKHYGAATVVNDVSFQIHKTTTIRMCLGLTAPDAATSTTTRPKAAQRWRCRATPWPSSSNWGW